MLENSGIKKGGGSTGRKNYKGNGKEKGSRKTANH